VDKREVLAIGGADTGQTDHGLGYPSHRAAVGAFRAQRVSVLDAGAFGETAAGYVRLGLVVDEARLLEACDRIAAFVRQCSG